MNTKKAFTFISLFLIVLFSGIDLYPQGYTPPTATIGASIDGLFAIHDAYGTDLSQGNNGKTYGMMWGRGGTIYTKIGLGFRKNHRIVISGSYAKFINSNGQSKTFFEQNGATNYDIYTGSLGYEYVFSARCTNKQFFGLAGTVNFINPRPGAIDFNNTIRFGLAANAGYELVLDSKYKTGLVFTFKYHLMNVFNATTGADKDMNDGAGSPGPGFWRRVGMISASLAFNFYLGTKPIKKY